MLVFLSLLFRRNPLAPGGYGVERRARGEKASAMFARISSLEAGGSQQGSFSRSGAAAPRSRSSRSGPCSAAQREGRHRGRVRAVQEPVWPLAPRSGSPPGGIRSRNLTCALQVGKGGLSAGHLATLRAKSPRVWAAVPSPTPSPLLWHPGTARAAWHSDQPGFAQPEEGRGQQGAGHPPEAPLGLLNRK